MICAGRVWRGVGGGVRRTGRFALAFSKMDDGIGGTGGIDTVNCCGGGGERERARAASELEDVRRCKRLCDALRGVLGGEDGKKGKPSESSVCVGVVLRVPNSSPSNQSCFWIFGVRVAGSGWTSFSRSGEPTSRGGMGGSSGWGGRWRRDREEMRLGNAGGDGSERGTS